MPKLFNVRTGKFAGNATNEEWEAIKSNPQYRSILRAESGIEDLPEVKELRAQEAAAAKAEDRKRRKTALIDLTQAPAHPSEEVAQTDAESQGNSND